MKRILIFSVAYHPFVGGAEVAVKEITDRISPHDIEFHMVTVNLSGREPAYERVGNVHVYRVGRGAIGKYLFPFLGFWKAVQLHKIQAFDATWSIMANYAGFAALFFKKKFPRVRFILTLQEGDPIGHIKRHVWWIYPIFLQIFRRADVIQTISTHLKKMAEDMGAKAPIHVIPNGVDTALFTQEYPEYELTALKQKLGKKEGDVFLITTSRLVHKNGIDTVIDALAHLPASYHFVVLGVGPLEKKCKAQAKRRGVADRVQFLGFVPYDQIPKFLKISDVFVRPSRSEGMGNSFIEAMAAGIPVVGTSVGGIAEFLHDKETGIVVSVNDPASIVRAVEGVVSDPALRQHLADRGYTLATTEYGWDKVVASIKQSVFSVL